MEVFIKGKTLQSLVGIRSKMHVDGFNEGALLALIRVLLQSIVVKKAAEPEGKAFALLR